MKKRAEGVHEGRRGFLKNAAVIGGAATAAAAGGGALAGAPTPREDGDKAEAPRARGYHETPHIRTYYEKARF